VKFKTCSKCNKKKSILKFYFRKDIQNYRADCRECVQAKRRIWEKNNLDHYREYHKKYRLKNRKIILKKGKEYYYKNDGAKMRRDWRKKNKKREHETARIYRLNNPEKIKKKQQIQWKRIKNNKELLLKQKNRLAEYRKTNKFLKWRENYWKQYFLKNKELIRARHKNYYNNNKSQSYLRVFKRRRNVLQQTPKWCDYKKMLAIYKKAEKMRDKGIMVNVDHIIPLNNKFVCGLNVPENLKIIEDKLNFSKSNKFIPFLNYKIYGTKKYYEMLKSKNYKIRIKSF